MKRCAGWVLTLLYLLSQANSWANRDSEVFLDSLMHRVQIITLLTFCKLIFIFLAVRFWDLGFHRPKVVPRRQIEQIAIRYF